MSDVKDIQQLIDSFVAYRNVLAPLQETLHELSTTYQALRTDLDSLTKNFSGDMTGQLEKIHATVSATAKSGQELSKRVDEYATSGQKYATAVDQMTKQFDQVAQRLQIVSDTEKAAEDMLARLEEIINEKRVSYNLKDLQKSLDGYNVNVEKISEFINKDIAGVLKQNAEKIETIRKESEQLAAVVAQQGQAVSQLTATFAETSALLRKTVENGVVNEQYIFEILDRWAADRKVKTKK